MNDPLNKFQNCPVAIITGGTGGIGEACCKSLAEEGFIVGINYRKDEAKAQEILSEIDNKGFLIPADITDIDQIEGMLSIIKQTTGRVDVLVNNAGYSLNKMMIAMTIDDFDHQRAVMRGAWFLTKRILRLFMLRQPSGRIINISSVTAHTGNAGQIPYTMEKASIDAMTKSLAREVAGRNILVNSVAPGFIDTKMTCDLPDSVKQKIIETIPLGRIGNPSEVSEVVAFLATKGSYIHGSIVHVNGGIYGG
ncbi:MAG: 3-oxoacyl-ACP reductase FabG [Proteobacteria bacterium]|nr:3-oxoacyl-ACP reductase FabG [Pseudomonadota bacterium]